MIQSSYQFLTVTLLTILTSPVTSQNPPCYICDGDATASRTIANPDTIVTLPPEYVDLIGVSELPCETIFNAGINGLIPANLCDTDSADADELQRVCGCPNFVAPTPVESPMEAPIDVPVDGPVDVPVDVPVDAPVDAPSSPPLSPPPSDILPGLGMGMGEKGEMGMGEKGEMGMGEKGEMGMGEMGEAGVKGMGGMGEAGVKSMGGMDEAGVGGMGGMDEAGVGGMGEMGEGMGDMGGMGMGAERHLRHL